MNLPSPSFRERILYRLVRAFYRTEVAHSSEMKSALQDIDVYDSYRANEIHRILEAVGRYDIALAGRTVMDFGCNDGAISAEYLRQGAARVVGVDVDERALARARELHTDERMEFVQGNVDRIPVDDGKVDTIISYDVFEHVSRPADILAELHRLLRPGGRILIGTWSWKHPFAPHLWSVMPVPWAHVLFGERTMLRVCRRVYHSPWYVPDMHDFDAEGQRLPDKFTNDAVSTDYLNKYLITDFERAFRAAGFQCRTNAVPFGSRYVRWTRAFLGVPGLREFLSGYVWFVLTKPETSAARTVVPAAQGR